MPRDGILTIVGSDFTINGTPVPYGEYDTMGQEWVHGTLTGTLANGDLLDNEFYIYGDSKIILSEPDASLRQRCAEIALQAPLQLDGSERIHAQVEQLGSD